MKHIFKIGGVNVSNCRPILEQNILKNIIIFTPIFICAKTYKLTI